MDSSNPWGGVDPNTLISSIGNPADALNAYQQSQQQSVARAFAIAQNQRQMQQQAIGDTALKTALADPSPQNLIKLSIARPDVWQSAKAAHDATDQDVQQQNLQDTSAVYGLLQSGNTDGAKAIVNNRIVAGQKAGRDVAGLQQLAQTIDANPKAAQTLAGTFLAATVGPDKFADTFGKIGSEQRAQAEEPGKEALTAAQTAQALAAARKDGYITAGPDQTVLALPGTPGAAAPAGAPAAAPSATPSGSDSSRAVRNNNPLNVTNLPSGKWAGQTGSDGKFATFASPAAGFAAADKNLQSYANTHGINTVQGIINRWAPAGDGANDPQAYAATVAASLGVDPNAPIDLSDKSVRKNVLQAMAKVESGGSAPPAAQAAGAAPVAAPGQLTPVFQGSMADVKDGLLSDDGVALVGQQYLSNGPIALQNLGQGKVGVQNKNRIMDWVARTAKEAGTSNPELVARFAQNKANAQALDANTKSLAAITSSENTLNANLDFAQQLAKRGLGPTGVPLLDTPINKVRMSLGSADAKTFDNVMKTSADEYARILTMGPNGGGGATSVEANKQAQSLINSGMTLRQLTDAINAAKTEAENRRVAYANTNHQLTSAISGVPYKPQAPVGGAPAPAAPSSGGWGKAVVVRR